MTDQEDDKRSVTDPQRTEKSKTYTYHLLFLKSGDAASKVNAVPLYFRVLCRNQTGSDQPERFDEVCRAIEKTKSEFVLLGALFDRVVTAEAPSDAWSKIESEYEGAWMGDKHAVGKPAIALEKAVSEAAKRQDSIMQLLHGKESSSN